MKLIALVSSAGGLFATQEVLSGLGPDLPAAIIVLQHTSPEHTSLLPEILQRDSALPVQPVVDGVEATARNVYVAPPRFHTLVAPGYRFSLIASGEYPPPRPSADLLLSTLATAVGPEAIVVVMSGGGNDGATGATAIHKHGGVVLATDQATSENFSMPAATIGRDQITDAVVPLSEVARRLTELALAGEGSGTPAQPVDVTG